MSVPLEAGAATPEPEPLRGAGAAACASLWGSVPPPEHVAEGVAWMLSDVSCCLQTIWAWRQPHQTVFLPALPAPT